MDRWMRGVPYEDCLLTERADELRNIKVNGVESLPYAVMLAGKTVTKMKAIKTAYMETHEATVDRGVDEILNRSLVGLFKKNFLDEIGAKEETS